MQAHAYTHARTYTLTHSHTRTCNGDRGKAHQELVGPQQTEEVVDERAYTHFYTGKHTHTHTLTHSHTRTCNGDRG